MATFAKEWRYRGEGNSSLVVADTKVSPFSQQLLRCMKQTSRPLTGIEIGSANCELFSTAL